MSFRDHFSGVAATYKDARPTYPDALIAFVASLPAHKGVAWDCGTGSGQVARALAAHFDRVEASDASAEQIEHAHTDDRVRFFVGPAEQSGLPDDSVDLVCAGAAAHWFDHDRFYAEVRRVARPGAAVALFSYGASVTLGDGALDQMLLDFAFGTIDAYWPERIGLLKARYLTLPFPFDDVDTPAFVIEQPASLDGVLNFVRTWSATQRAEAEHPGTFQSFADALTAQWGKAESAPQTLSLDVFMRAGRV